MKITDDDDDDDDDDDIDDMCGNVYYRVKVGGAH